MSVQLSPGISYYIRKLLRQNLDRLYFEANHQSAIKPDPTSDLNGVLSSLYPDLQQCSTAARELETLALMHQTLNGTGAANRPELQRVEAQIFQLLHFRSQEYHRKGNVLVVDDVPTNIQVLATALSRQGYEVQTATTGKTAIACIESLIPDVILLDIMMPDMDGYAVCNHLKNYTLTRDVPIIFVSAVHDAASKVRAFGAGGADYITKPFQIEEVLVRVDNQINLRTLQKRLEVQNLRLQDELRVRQQVEERYRLLFERSSEGMFQTSPSGKYVKVNPALARLYGYTSPQDLLQTIDDIGRQLYVDPQRRDQLSQQLADQNSLREVVSEVYCKDGSTIWISENIHVVRDGHGKPLYYEGTVHQQAIAQPA
jgi:adenylate cyclase